MIVVLTALLLAAAPSTDGDTPMRAPRTYEGVWLDGFEESRFFPDALAAADLDVRGSRIWLEVDRDVVRRMAVRRGSTGQKACNDPQGCLYKVRFVGREAQDMDCPRGQKPSNPPRYTLCYGHLGASAGLVAVDRLLQVTPLGPMRR